MSVRDFLRPPHGPTFLGAPAWRTDSGADIVVIGVGFDMGTFRSRRSPSVAPGLLRQASAVYAFAGVSEPSPPGWWDYTIAAPVLAGRRIADAGDLVIDAMNPQPALQALAAVIAELGRDAQLVLVLGGDHSITQWTTPAAPAARPVLLHFDAHEDATALTGAVAHPGNVMALLETGDRFEAIIQFGLRGMVPNLRRDPAPVRRIAGSLGELGSAIAGLHGRDCVLSIDVDVLDPSLLRSVSSPSPGGCQPADLVDAVRLVRKSGLRPRLVEIVEFAPDSGVDWNECFLLVQTMMRLLDAALNGDE